MSRAIKRGTILVTCLLLFLALVSCASAEEYDFSLSAAEVQTEEEFSISFFYPGADQIDLTAEMNGNPQWYWHEESNLIEQTISCGTEGTVSFRAGVSLNGEWIEFDIGHTVTATAPNGSLDNPQFSFPAEVQEGSDLTVSYTPVNAGNSDVWYYFWCDSYEDEGFNSDNELVVVDEQNHSFTIPAMLLTPGQVYRFHCVAASTGYNCFQYDQSVMVNPSQAPQIDDGDTTLTIRPSATDIQTFTDTAIAVYAPANQAFPAADAFKVFIDGNEEQYFETEAGFRYLFSRAYPGEYVVSVSAHYPDENGGYWTDYQDCSVSIHVNNSNGNLPAPDVNVADRAWVGDKLQVEFAYNANATFYSFWVHKWDSGERCYWNGISSDELEEGQNAVLEFDTAGLESGVYFIELDMNAPGYKEGHSLLHLALLDRGDTDLSDPNGAYYFTLSSQSIRPRQDLHVIYYVPGTTDTRVFSSENDQKEALVSPGLDFWWSWGGLSEKTLYGQYISIGGSDWSDPVELGTVKIESPDGWLDAPDFSMPDVIGPNEDLVVTFNSPVANAHSYSYWYKEEAAGGALGYDGRSFLDEEKPLSYGQFPFNLTIPAGRLEAGKAYRFFLDVNREGWVEGHAEHVVYVTEDNPSIKITVPDTVNFGDSFDIQVNVPENTQRLIVLANGIGQFDDAVENNPATISIAPVYPDNGSAGTVHVVAEAQAGDGWVYASVIVPYDEAAGILGTPEYEMPSVINAGEDLTISFTRPIKNAVHYSYWYSLDDHEEDQWDESRSAGVDIDQDTEFPLTFTIPAGTLEAGNLYRFRLDVDAYTWVEGHAEHVVYVKGTDEDESITIGDPLNQPRFNSEFFVPVSAPGAKNIVVYVDGEEHWFEGEYAEVRCFFDSNPGGGSITLLAEARIDGSWSHAADKTVYIPAPEGFLGAPTLESVTGSVTRGDFVAASISRVDSAENYRVWFRPTDDLDGWSGDYGTGAGENTDESYVVYIPTADLEAGSYTVHAYVSTEGWANGDADQELTFTVINPENPEDNKFYIPEAYSQYEHYTGTPIPWSAHASWADAIKICVSDNANDITDRSRDDRNEYGYYDGSSATGELMFDYPADYYFYAVGHTVDDNGNSIWDYLGDIEEQAIPIHITAPFGEMPAPYCSLDRNQDNDGYVFSIDTHNQSSNIDVWIEDTVTRQEIFAEWRTYRSEFRFPDTDLIDGHVYLIHYTVWGIGYIPYEGSHSFIYSTGEPSTGLTLTVPDEISFGRGFDIYASAEGADRIVIYINGEQFEYDGDSAAHWYVPYTDDGTAGTITVYAQACVDGDWNYVAGPVARHFDAATDTLGAPTVTLGSGSVPRGQFITATLSNVNNAHDYRVWVYDENGIWQGDYNVYTDSNDQNMYTIQIPTSNLTPGSYGVHAYVTAEGYVNGDAAADETFEVTELPGSKYFVPESERNLVTGEHFHVSAYAPGADRIRICVSQNADDIHNPETYEYNVWAEFEGDQVISSHWIDSAGTWYTYALGHWHFEDDQGEHDYWDYLGEADEQAIELTVTSSGEEVEQPEWYLPDRVTGTCSFSIYPGDDATNIDVVVTDVRTGRTVFEEYRTNRTEFSIPANRFVNGRIYNISFSIWGYNKEPFSYGHGFLYSTDDPINHVNLMLPSQLTRIEDEAFANLPATVFYIPSSVSSISSSAFDGTYTVLIIDSGNTGIINWARDNGITVIER